MSNKPLRWQPGAGSAVRAWHNSGRHSWRHVARTGLLTLGLLGVLGCSPTSQAALQFHWEDDFSTTERAKLTRWLTETNDALVALVGELPFTTHLYLHRTRAGEPVPWANTERSRIQGVHLHVDPSFSLEAFRQDWTAPHELSHLVLPYVGRNNAWFAEGFASYMQYQVMHKMGVLSAAQMRARYAKNLNRAARRYPHHSQPFAKAADRLRAERNYPTMYWGGAAFFLQVDTFLKQQGESGLIATLNDYTDCCRMRGRSLNGVVTQLDRLGGTTALADLLHTFKTRPGFPTHKGLDMGPSTNTASTGG